MLAESQSQLGWDIKHVCICAMSVSFEAIGVIFPLACSADDSRSSRNDDDDDVP